MGEDILLASPCESTLSLYLHHVPPDVICHIIFFPSSQLLLFSTLYYPLLLPYTYIVHTYGYTYNCRVHAWFLYFDTTSPYFNLLYLVPTSLRMYLFYSTRPIFSVLF